jgi:hypothetical protein
VVIKKFYILGSDPKIDVLTEGSIMNVVIAEHKRKFGVRIFGRFVNFLTEIYSVQHIYKSSLLLITTLLFQKFLINFTRLYLLFQECLIK